ncbi:MAG TPA: DinB family protein [Gemmatimonadales bacterium]|nr:DinB family protein [Gemmatimonadales bacterium]
MESTATLRDLILPAWRTNALITERVVRALPMSVYDAAIPGLSRRTVRSVAAHLHTSRCGWVRTLGSPYGVAVPAGVDRQTVSRAELGQALRQSARAMTALLSLGCERGGRVPATARYVWRNLALDVGHVLTYFVAHEAHHRGQLVLIARQLGHPLPASVTAGLWQWKPDRPGRRVRRH